MPEPAEPRPHISISVALCTFNGARWLGPLLASLAAQEHLPSELVVQDDASDDDSCAVVRDFARDAPFPVHLEVNATRVGSTRNFALALARASSDVVALADQDDIWYPHKLQRLGAAFLLDPTVTMMFTDADLVDDRGDPLRQRLWATRGIDQVLRGEDVVDVVAFARRSLTTGCTMAVRRQVLDLALPLPDELLDDRWPMRHDRWLSLVAATMGTVRALHEPLLAFRVHSAQETGLLVGRAKLTAYLRSARHVARPTGPPMHTIRAAQLRAAARRADDLGDFDAARDLRAQATHHLSRHEAGEGASSIRTILRDARRGSFGDSLASLRGVTADLYRHLRHNR